eukprot:TRINITY_DN1938_c0_g1_i10.p1 TRINITY_DN1938_c0_g1~~TRINITY_DN1938_c0_g1_i10.p1  ORF type:complete len:236 (+),score=49.53 TRINITY_DN1938_c0_g1_i10:819-1526(+)
MLKKILKSGPDYISNSGGFDGDEYFWATQNARVVCDAEKYYRNTYLMNGYQTWNLRDSHMLDSLLNLIQFHQSRGIERVKAVVWAHNSHVGDARATEYSVRGEHNLGQLIREKFGESQIYTVGFTTFTGTVTASQSWGGDSEMMTINPAENDSYEHLFHVAYPGNFTLIVRSLNPSVQINTELQEMLFLERYERMIGVQYCKARERQAHYLICRLSKQFDAVVHFDTTQALVPLK